MRTRLQRERMRDAGMTEIILSLPRDLVAEIDALKSRDGLRSRSQVVQQVFTAGRATDQHPV